MLRGLYIADVFCLSVLCDASRGPLLRPEHHNERFSKRGKLKLSSALVTHLLSTSSASKFQSSLFSRSVKARASNSNTLPNALERHGREGDVNMQLSTEVLADPMIRAREFRKKHKIELNGNNVDSFIPFYDYASTPFAPAIKEIFQEQGYVEPFPIQSVTWPFLESGRDVISIARSGSGKTLAFLAPAFQRLILRPSERPPSSVVDTDESDSQMIGTKLAIPHELVKAFKGKGGENFKKMKKRGNLLSVELGYEGDLVEGEDRNIIIKGPQNSVHALKKDLLIAMKRPAKPRILVLAPTRELVMQIYEEAEKYTRAAGVRAMRLIGSGTTKEQQVFLLRTIRPEIVIATPGRCKDLEEMGELKLNGVEYLVLDEADRMLNLGFNKQMRGIIKQIKYSGPRAGLGLQISMFSATWPQKVRAFADYFLKNDPVKISIGSVTGLNANQAITQHVKMVKESEKELELLSLLKELNADGKKDLDEVPKIMVFCTLKKNCNLLRDNLREAGYSAESFHSDLRQHERTKALNQFRNDTLKILVATEAAARGLDIPNVKAVINYDMPQGKEAAEFYVHRIGRTARGENDGLSYTFFTKGDKKTARDLTEVLKRAGQEVPEELLALSLRAGERHVS